MARVGPSKFAIRLRKERGDKSYLEFSKELGNVSNTSLRLWENEMMIPSTRSVKNLSNKLKWDKDTLEEMIQSVEIERNDRYNRFKLDSKFYEILHELEIEYGGLINCPITDERLGEIHDMLGVEIPEIAKKYDLRKAEKLRLDRGLTKEQLSLELGYGRATYDNIISTWVVSQQNLELFSNYFNVPISYFERDKLWQNYFFIMEQ